MKKFIVCYSLMVSSLFAQNLDSLFNKYISKYETNPKQTAFTTGSTERDAKCSFELNGLVAQHFNEFTKYQQDQILAINARPETQKSKVSPMGIFRIHYDTTGLHIPKYFSQLDFPGQNVIELSVDSLATALDKAYSYEVSTLGYDAPPTDNGEGGDDLYDVYIRLLGSSLYGETSFTIAAGEITGPSYIRVNNDYTGFSTEGINGAKVTAAHEFHHAIQIGSYAFRSDDVFYYELTSTSMEEFVYDYINDYYGYIKSFFNNPEKSFVEQSGYNLALWNIFLIEEFKDEDPTLGHKIIKRSWEFMRQYSAIESIAFALAEYGKDYKQVFSEFGSWIYFTNSNTKVGSYFSEAQSYPLLEVTMTDNFTGPQSKIMGNSNPFSYTYIRFIEENNGFTDTLISVINNVDIEATKSRPVNGSQYDYTLFNFNSTGSNRINDKYYSLIESVNKINLVESNILNNEPAGNFIPRESIDFAYPQPFRYSVNNYMFIPTEANNNETSDLNIYTVDMILVYDSVLPINKSGKTTVKWNAKDNNGNKLASGVYIYVTKNGDSIKKGKLVIYNE